MASLTETARLIESALGNSTTIDTGQDTVSSPGSPEQLNGGTSISIPDGAVVAVRADVATSGDFVYIGDSSVSPSTGFKLSDGNGLSLQVDDVATIYIDVDTAGDGVSWVVET